MNKINKIEVLWDGRAVGTLALTPNGLCAFEYTPEFIAGGVSVSPFKLPLKNGVTVANPRPFDGGFGVFDDCLPDGWGMLILDRFLRKKGISPRSLTILDRLAVVGSSGRGALEFRPDLSNGKPLDFADFEMLSDEAQKILESDGYTGAGIEEFMFRGGSPGGARPKIFTKYDGREWLVKFRAKGDSENIGRMEYEYSLLAKKCGVEMPETRLFENKFFGTERFDRTGGGKLHVVSMAGLLDADYRSPSIDYLHIFQVGAALTHNIRELWKIFRLMVFNILIGNKDDHAKNFAFLYRGGSWHFAPAFDILPGEGMNGYHTTSVNDSITPTKKDLLETAKRSSLDIREAERIFDEIYSVIKAAGL